MNLQKMHACVQMRPILDEKCHILEPGSPRNARRRSNTANFGWQMSHFGEIWFWSKRDPILRILVKFGDFGKNIIQFWFWKKYNPILVWGAWGGNVADFSDFSVWNDARKLRGRPKHQKVLLMFMFWIFFVTDKPIYIPNKIIHPLQLTW